ncbi:FHA domain-containing protein [Teredinibacter purpureus]|uniref:FHA domain-containing protein n=1 Tax=Teredinibacter purpureus TaxID=2731756 RepID=UPI0005F87679|nr:FHA domain-containing protein [Teredinibacter purpureus]
MAYLRHLVNGTTATLYELGESTLIGRSNDCPIKVDDPTVSGKHAKIEKMDAGWRVVDLASTNGIFANGVRVNETVLGPGVTLAIGTHEFEYLANLPQDLERTLIIKKSWIPGVYYTE